MNFHNKVHCVADLTAEEKELRETARKFVRDHVIPVAAQYDKTGEVN